MRPRFLEFYVGNTDEAWFRFNAARQPGEVNFWRPRDQAQFRAVDAGGPFLFRLKRPHNAIAGVGFYSFFRLMPARAAWDAFREENGAADFHAFLTSLGRLSNEDQPRVADREIGCVILSDPVFFDESDWIPSPRDWARSVQTGKRYSTADDIGRELWSEIEMRLSERRRGGRVAGVHEIDQPRLQMFGEPTLVRPRLGQGSFRLMTLDNYRHTCCITGEATRNVIEAANILPVSRGGEHRLDNGLALRADMHILYDRGLLAIDPDYRVHVSPRIRHEYHNGVVYYTHEGQQLRVLPDDSACRPNRDFLDRHYREAFIA